MVYKRQVQHGGDVAAAREHRDDLNRRRIGLETVWAKAQGDLGAAAQEERFTRKKHDYAFPSHAAAYCLEAGGLADASELDHVVFYDKPLVKFERLLETYLAFAPAGIKSWLTLLPNWLRTRLHLPRVIKKGLDRQSSRRTVFP